MITVTAIALYCFACWHIEIVRRIVFPHYRKQFQKQTPFQAYLAHINESGTYTADSRERKSHHVMGVHYRKAIYDAVKEF